MIRINERKDWDKEPDERPEVEEIHTLCVETDLERLGLHPVEWGRYVVPTNMVKEWEFEQRQLKSPVIVDVTPGYRKWGTFANIEVRPTTLSADGLTLDFVVNCNPGHMCAPHDLVPVFLEARRSPTEKFRYLVVLLQPRWPLNAYHVTVHYTLAQLAIILKLDITGKTPEEAIQTIRRSFTEVALLAQWLAEKEQSRPSANGPNHESGGLLQKGGSGKIRLAPITLAELERTEGVRNTEWNMGELLRAGRPVFDRHPVLLEPEEEMATMLEAESEYLTDEGTLMAIVDELTKLADTPDRWAEFGLIGVKGSRKVYHDCYFDLPDLTLLRRRIVLRQRSVSTDPASAYLFTCKGSTISDKGEVLRLAGQARLVKAVVNSARGPDLICQFLADQAADNAVARVLHHALGPDKTLFTAGDRHIVEVMKVVSTRYKFAFKLADGTVIEFSADDATGTLPDGRGSRCFSFEFGVGHPGLNAATTTSTSMSTTTATGVQALIAQFDRSVQAQVTRPYHVPADLTLDLLHKSDYVGYRKLRDALIVKVFRLDPANLERGGNKARTLAIQLGLFED